LIRLGSFLVATTAALVVGKAGIDRRRVASLASL